LGKKQGSELTEQQAAFVRFYLISLNASEAAKKAGYSAESAGSLGWQLLQKPTIKLAIKKATEKRAKRLEITADNVLRELARIGFADIRKVAAFDPELGLLVKASDEIDDDDAATISEITESKSVIKGKRGDSDVINTTLKVKQHDKLRALDLLGKHLGLFKDGNQAPEDPKPVGVAYLPKSEREEKK
jgi:phage terminase small subunit